MPASSTATDSLTTIVQDLRNEGDELFALLSDMDTGYWTEHSSFKDWTVWDVVAHLHLSDHMALTSLTSADAFETLMQDIRNAGMGSYTLTWLQSDDHSLTGPGLLERWYKTFGELCHALASADPQARFVWAGPGMKARMFATARQMEIWAHGWEIYDLMAIPRQHTDRLRNIAEIGVRTFGWTFANRSLEVPHEVPFVELISPSGTRWTWNDPASEHRVMGNAVEFCQVVTQVRNIADTALTLEGDNAIAWMQIAQCFAGPPEEPPAPGSRIPDL